MKINLTLFLFLCTTMVWSQQATQYSLYAFNPYAFNPAYAGMDESLSFTGVYRRQWIGLEGSPTSQNVSIHTPLYFLGGGIGLNANNDEIGAHRISKISLSYAKYLSVGDEGQLSIGLAGGIAQQSFDGNRLRTPEGQYDELTGTILHNDDFLSENNITAITPVFGIGLYYNSPNLKIGLSSNNIAESNFLYTLTEETKIQNKRDYYMNASYQLDLLDALSISPNLLIKTDLTEIQTDLTLLFTYNEIIFAGASYRGFNANTNDAVVFLIGTQVNANVKFAYAYDMTLSKLKSVNTGTHEVMLQYNLNKKIGGGIPPPIIYNPRSL